MIAWPWPGRWLALARSGEPPARMQATPGARSAANDNFETFFMQHEAAIAGYLWRMTGDEATASDLCQETFLRAWQHFDAVRGYDRPRAWLWRVATNLALHHLRRRRLPVGAAIPLAEDLGPGASDPAGQLAERDQVRAALLELTPNARAMLVLREVYGLEGDEIALAMGTTRTAVKMALWRARGAFRAAYLRQENGR